ncbi:DUF1989 domain-containing protein [Acinetobacter terrae]|uniref:DUF1989 domain-containing protein n=1 Tax=Acinetobacter terrae TaxID=2731247 RepID=UPI0007D7D0DA|nr:aminomethyltransferase family protein [Acinetobacter terrae]OAL83116.1 aminomethyltransferase [Acinetobacter terrae]
MGNFEQSISAAALDEFIHLQLPITELHLRIEPQMAQRFDLAKGDVIELKIPSHQTLELLVFNLLGQLSPEFLHCERQSISKATQTAIHTYQQLEQNNQSAKRLQQQLDFYHIQSSDLEQAIVLNLTGSISLQALESLQLIVMNTGVDMLIDQQNPIEEIAVLIHPVQPLYQYLPEPLACPIQDIHIPRASAKTYYVKAGQWIQIIDISGKQCSDFLAFDATLLELQQEVTLDAGATRTILGHSTPQPGIHSRFYASDMQSMLEVIQDTVGRHDMFLTACSTKFYEDSGYFGHLSCTDNFNQILKSFGIAPRSAWPAINFFYNTRIEACGTIGMAEPWSKPGDYVLLRATRDLLCASSACPDDIDASNGWVPTDIHVRIYDQDHFFPRSQHYRTMPEEMPRMTKTSGFYSRISELTSKLGEYHGYWIANEFNGWGAKAEYLACRERVAMIDLSALRKFEITGPDAEAFLQYALTRNVRKLAINEIVYSASCLETGGMVDDGTLFRMGEQNFRWICGDEYSGTWLKQKAQEKNFKVSIRNSSDQIHNIAIQGPLSRSVLQKLLWTPEHQSSIDQLAWFHFTLGRLGGPNGIPVMVSRTGYTGELGFEVWCHPNQAEQLWDAVWTEGQQYGIAPMGFDALDMLRIEAGLIFAQHEFDAHTNPYEAGIGFTIPLKTKDEDFLGKQALKNQMPESRHKLMGLILEDNEPVHHGDHLYVGHFPVGVVTSATNSPLLKKQIALCRVAPEYAQLDAMIEVGQLDGLKKRLKAKLVSLPFYDPERLKVRS